MTSVAQIPLVQEPKKDYFSPDDFFTPKADASNSSGYEIAYMLLTQTHASITCLMADGDDGSFSMNHKMIMNLLWSIQTQIEMSKLALEKITLN